MLVDRGVRRRVVARAACRRTRRIVRDKIKSLFEPTPAPKKRKSSTTTEEGDATPSPSPTEHLRPQAHRLSPSPKSKHLRRTTLRHTESSTVPDASPVWLPLRRKLALTVVKKGGKKKSSPTPLQRRAQALHPRQASPSPTAPRGDEPTRASPGCLAGAEERSPGRRDDLA